jgi:hypothetical protein
LIGRVDQGLLVEVLAAVRTLALMLSPQFDIGLDIVGEEVLEHRNIRRVSVLVS